MDSDDYRRFLSHLSIQQLEEALKYFELPSAGNKEIKISTLAQNYILPSSILKMLSVDELRVIARDSGSRIAGTKEDVIDNLINYFDRNEDIKTEITEEPQEVPVEIKLLAEKNFKILFGYLSNDDLYDIASKLTGLALSGVKQKRVDKFWASPYSEKTLLGKMPNESLRQLCYKSGMTKGGDKIQLIEKIIEKYKGFDTVDERDQEARQIGKLNKENEIDLRKELPQLPYVEREFGYLSPDEKIVLSAIMDLKSMSDEELVRLASHFELNWVLTKACMSEMIEKLKQNNKEIINIRSVGDNNFYEYRG